MSNSPNIPQDLRFQHAEWRLQRLGWISMAAILLAGILGLLGGSGPLSSVQTTSTDGNLSISYRRFDRRHRDTQWTLHINAAPTDSELRLRLNQSFLSHIQLESIAPEPLRVEHAGDHQIWVFHTAPAANSPITIILSGRFESAGNVPAEIALGTSTVAFRQFIYP